MTGIVSYGGYIPRLRLSRMSIFQNMGWFAPAIIMVAQGERSFCNWDEDSVSMAVESSRDCLKGLDKSKVDAHYLCSTTLPFSDRLCAGIAKTALNLRDDVLTEDFTNSLRCGTSALLTAFDVVKAGGKKQVLVTATDKREAKAGYFYEMWFGDGAASVLVGDTDVIAEFVGGYTVSYDFIDHYRGSDRKYDYMWEERWVRDEGYSKIIPEAVTGLFKKLSITIKDVDTLVFPCFFKTEHRNIARTLGATADKVVDNLHEVCGETGAAHPLVMLAYALDQAKAGDRILLAGFGQGCDALYFKVTDNISKLPRRRGIKGSLENKKTSENYLKFLKFRDLLQTEMGIRAEAPTQTAMTVLWRKRKMLLGLVGGKCRQCGTAQFPQMKICVNPDCRAVDSQDEWEFSNQQAFIKSFTGDLLSVSVDPPAVYGMIQFEGGGRLYADFTDCEMGDVSVGQPVTLSFRKRYTDKERGFTGYFWKAVPVPGWAPAKEEPEIRFDGRVAIVTGAGGGLGRAYALELGKRGAKVVVNDLGGGKDGSGGSQSASDKVVEEIKAMGGDAVASYESVSTAEGGEAIVDKAVRAFGRVDIVINNAGILRDRTFAKMDGESWDAVMGVHLKGAYHVTRPAFVKMREQGYGRVVLTSSAAGLYGNFGQTNYSAAKMGLVGLMNTLKLEGEKHNIKVNTVVPIAGTRLTEGVLPPEIFERLKPEFVAPIVLYLSSEQCPVTGGIYSAGMGFFNRAAVVTGPGTLIGEGKEIPTPEEVAAQMAKIKSLSGAKEYGNAVAAYGPMLDVVSGKKAEAEPEAGAGLTVKKIIERIPEVFRPEKAVGLDVVFQFVIGGGGGGTWHVVVKEKRCEVKEGAHEKPTTTIKMGSEDFVKMIQGQLNAMSAYTSGKLKIEGDLMKSQLVEKLFKF